jgi:hypothetical protein
MAESLDDLLYNSQLPGSLGFLVRIFLLLLKKLLAPGILDHSPLASIPFRSIPPCPTTIAVLSIALQLDYRLETVYIIKYGST